MDPLDAGKTIGTRFYLVSLLPSLVTVGGLWLMWATGGADSQPSWSEFMNRLAETPGTTYLMLLGIGLTLAILTYPLQLRAVKMVEGYLPTQRSFGRALAAMGIARHARKRQQLQNMIDDIAKYEYLAGEATEEEVRRRKAELDRALRHVKGRVEMMAATKDAANSQLDRLPRADRLMPTALGNALRAAEDLPLKKYGIPGVQGMGHLIALMPRDYTTRIDDIRNDLDQAVRMTLAWATLTVGALAFFINDGPWLFVAAVCWSFVAISYSGAIAVAESYGQLINRSFDLFRHLLFASNGVAQPLTPRTERDTFENLFRFFNGDTDVSLEFVTERSA